MGLGSEYRAYGFGLGRRVGDSGFAYLYSPPHCQCHGDVVSLIFSSVGLDLGFLSPPTCPSSLEFTRPRCL